MATKVVRWFPVTTDPSILECLADVPKGTALAVECGGTQGTVDKVRDAWRQLVRINEQESHYGTIIGEAIKIGEKGLKDEEDYRNFLQFGFGRIVLNHSSSEFWQSSGLNILKGQTSNPEFVRAIAKTNGLDDEKIELLIQSGGIRWGA